MRPFEVDDMLADAFDSLVVVNVAQIWVDEYIVDINNKYVQYFCVWVDLQEAGR